MKAILITLGIIIVGAISTNAQESVTLEKTNVKTKTATFKAEDGAKPSKKRKRVKANFKEGEKGKKGKRTKATFKAADGEEPKKVKTNANF